MRLGVIDLGTNSVRFDVHQIGPQVGARMRIRELHREKLMIRLGQGVFLDGKLDATAVRRTLEAFQSFKRTADELKAHRIVAFATSALREAQDSEKLLAMIRKRTGIQVRVISGEEEARLIALGVLSHERQAKGRFALIDIGGGSTEISICSGKEQIRGDSFPLGTARLQQVFLKRNPPRPSRKGDPGAIEELRRHIKSILLPRMIAEQWPKAPRVLGSSGTIKAILRIIRKSDAKKFIDRGSLRRLIKEMSTMTTTQLLGLPGLESRRVDMILAGAILLEESMEAIGAKRVYPTDYSLRDGILESELRLVKKAAPTHLAMRLEDLYAKAGKFGATEARTRRAALVAGLLFDRLRRLHRLGPEWRTYLQAAMILRNVGEAVAPARHQFHSYYIVKNSDLLNLEEWEQDFIAELCFRHGATKLSAKDLPFRDNKVRRTAYLKLLALLRVADALDPSDGGFRPGNPLRDVKVARGGVKLLLARAASSELEILRVDQRKALFEDIFRRSLSVERT